MTSDILDVSPFQQNQNTLYNYHLLNAVLWVEHVENAWLQIISQGRNMLWFDQWLKVEFLVELTSFLFTLNTNYIFTMVGKSLSMNTVLFTHWTLPIMSIISLWL